MQDARISSIPPLNHEAQVRYLTIVGYEEHPITGEARVIVSTPLRWLLYNLEKILYVDSLPNADAEVTSDPEASCPICFEEYFKTSARLDKSSEAVEQEKVRNERPLKLECGHILGRTCLHDLLNISELSSSKCPLCRHLIHPCILPNAGLFPHNGEDPNVLKLLCIAIRIYLRRGPDTMPETRAGLIEWVHSIGDETEEELGEGELGEGESGEEESGEGELGEEELDKGQLDEGQLGEEQMDENKLRGSRLQWVRHAVEIWDRRGEHDIWVVMGNRVLGSHLLD